MIAFPSMLEQAATDAGIPVPPNSDTDDYDLEAFPRFYLFCVAQLGRPMVSPGAHWENAKVIAALPEDQIKSITYEQLLEKGWTL